MHRAQPPIVHRDLKLENVLVDASGKYLRLCDFGSATTEVYSPDESWSMSQRTGLEVCQNIAEKIYVHMYVCSYYL